jgi:hypothetical protein
MSISREELVKLVVAKLAFVDGSGEKHVRIDEIAKITGLEKRIIERNILHGKISTLGEDLNEENAEKLIGERLLGQTRPEIEPRLISFISDILKNKLKAADAKPPPIPVPESPTNKPPLTPEIIIKNFIIVDGSNVLHWLKDARLDDRVNLIPLLILLTAMKRKTFSFWCCFDRSKELQLRDDQPKQFQELEKVRQKYKVQNYFSVAHGGTSADDFIVLNAKNSGRRVLSNDRFRDEKTHVPRLPKKQLIPGMVGDCQILIPELEIIESLHSDLQKAVRDLETELNK